MRIVRTCAALLAASLVSVGAVSVGTAAGTNNVVSVIKARDRMLNSSPVIKKLGQVNFRKLVPRAQAKLALSATREFAHLLSGNVTAVSRASTVGAQQREGKADWLAGYRTQIRGLADYEHEIKDVIGGKTAAAERALHQAQALLDSGNVTANTGDKLLGLSTHY